MVKEVLTGKVAQSSPIVVAGPKPSSLMALRPANREISEKDNVDPWSEFRSSKGMSTGPVTSTQIKAAAVAAGGVPTGGGARQVDAPTAAKFAALEERLGNFETAITTLQSSHGDIGQVRLPRSTPKSILNSKRLIRSLMLLPMHLIRKLKQLL